jgi:hypothetical protein
MIASGVTRSTLEYAARDINVQAYITALNEEGTRHRVKLYPTVPNDAWQIDPKRVRLCPVCGERVTVRKDITTLNGHLVGTCGDAAPASRWANGKRWKDERGDSPFQRESVGYGSASRRVHAVCWHGFRDFFRAVYRREPGAVFRTAVATWRGSDDFEARYRASGHKNVGSQAVPVAMAEACRCPDSGRAI